MAVFILCTLHLWQCLRGTEWTWELGEGRDYVINHAPYRLNIIPYLGLCRKSHTFEFIAHNKYEK